MNPFSKHSVFLNTRKANLWCRKPTKLEEIELRAWPEAQSLKINGEIQQVTFQRIISTCTVGLIMPPWESLMCDSRPGRAKALPKHHSFALSFNRTG